jgi:hypothetical protein
MNPRPIARLLMAAGLLIELGGSTPRVLLADDKPASEAAKASSMASEELKHWSIRSGIKPDRLAKVGKDPVLRYSNPGVGRVYGEVFLFTSEGRPEAIMAVYKWFTPWTGFEAEMHSLSTETLKAERDGRVVWQPDRPGLAWNDVPDAALPATSAVARLAQMRSIAGDFTGRLLDARVAAAGENQSIRLLPKPLYRNEPVGSSSPDGAVFAFVVGTDPEVFLLLETRKTPLGLRWQYALVRMNRDPIRVMFKGKVVWAAEKVDPRLNLHSAYFSMELPQEAATP